jgi:hypothetical protein
MAKKTDDELIESIRGCGQSIDTCWHKAFPIGGNVELEGLRAIESYANALAIFCKLLRQRLEAQDPAIQHLRKTLAEGE